MDIDMEDSVLANKELEAQVDKAQFKLSLIGPLIYKNHGFKSQAAYIRHILEVTKTWPDGRKFCVKPCTVKKWYYQYRKGGFKALLKEDRADKGSTRRLSKKAQDEIKRLRLERPNLVATEIRKHLLKEGLTQASIRTVQRYANTIEIPTEYVSHEKERRAFQMPVFGRMWQCDTQHAYYIVINGKSQKVYCMQIIDDCTRMIVGGGMVLHDTAANFQLFLKEAIMNYGIPQMLMGDYAEKLTMPNLSESKNVAYQATSFYFQRAII